MKRIVPILFLFLMFATVVPAQNFRGGIKGSGVGITRLVIEQSQVVFDGQSFGSVGQYELLTGTAYGELDPKAPGNAGIVNLDAATRNARGHVEYSADIAILKPVDMSKGSGTLLYDVVNRGSNKIALGQLNGGGANFTGADGEMKWTETAVTHMQLKSFIARVSREGSRYNVFGVVLNDGTPLKSVEVRVDDGPWQPAKMDPATGSKYSWKLFNYAWNGAMPGEHTLVSRVTDVTGRAQPTEEELANKKTFLEDNSQFPRKVMIS